MTALITSESLIVRAVPQVVMGHFPIYSATTHEHGQTAKLIAVLVRCPFHNRLACNRDHRRSASPPPGRRSNADWGCAFLTS